MLDGFNEGWIDFPEGDPGVLKGRTSLRDVIAGLVRAEVSASNAA